MKQKPADNVSYSADQEPRRTKRAGSPAGIVARTSSLPIQTRSSSGAWAARCKRRYLGLSANLVPSQAPKTNFRLFLGQTPLNKNKTAFRVVMTLFNESSAGAARLKLSAAGETPPPRSGGGRRFVVTTIRHKPALNQESINNRSGQFKIPRGIDFAPTTRYWNGHDTLSLVH